MPNYSTNLKTWGSTGQEYPDNYSYVEGEQPVDAWDNFLTTNIINDIEHLIDVTNNELLARDGSVNLQGDLSDDQGNTVWDYSLQAVPEASQEASDITVTAGDGLKGGGSLSNQGGSTTLNVEPADFAGGGLQDDGSDNLALSESGLSVSAGDGLKGGGSVALGGSTTLNVEPVDFAGNGLQDDGSDNLEVLQGSGSGLDADTVDGFDASDIGGWTKITDTSGTLTLGADESTTITLTNDGSYDIYRIYTDINHLSNDHNNVGFRVNSDSGNNYSFIESDTTTRGNENSFDLGSIGSNIFLSSEIINQSDGYGVQYRSIGPKVTDNGFLQSHPTNGIYYQSNTLSSIEVFFSNPFSSSHDDEYHFVVLAK